MRLQGRTAPDEAMAHPAQFTFFEQLAVELPSFFAGTVVGEVGSLDINGSIRGIFRDCDYTGFDIGDGPGVDVVCPGQEIGSPTGHFDAMVSAECFEHNPFWVETLANMLRMTRPGGLVAISVATTGRAEHGTPRTSARESPLTVSRGGDWAGYYENLTDKDILRAINLRGWLSGFHFVSCPAAQDLYLWGIRRVGADDSEVSEGFRAHVLTLDHTLAASIGAVTISHYTDAVGLVARGVVPR